MKVKNVKENANTSEEVSIKNGSRIYEIRKSRKKWEQNSHILQHSSQFLNKKMHLNCALRGILLAEPPFFPLLRDEGRMQEFFIGPGGVPALVQKGLFNIFVTSWESRDNHVFLNL